MLICLISQQTTNSASIHKSVSNVFKTCLYDSQCSNSAMFCDHVAPNPIGSCTKKHKNGEKCTFDRHCMSDKCNWNKCVASKPKKDGKCSKSQHHECIDSQYCKSNKCIDRHLGSCLHDYECLSNKCSLFMCKKHSVSAAKKP